MVHIQVPGQAQLQLGIQRCWLLLDARSHTEIMN
jgi:hypothetical protein